MANRIDRRDRRNAEHGYDWETTEFPWTYTGKAVPMSEAGARIARLIRKTSEFAERLAPVVQNVADAVTSLVEKLNVPPDELRKLIPDGSE